ncbi:hypothetical protein D9M72_580370 [compost metagenome]
MESAVPSNLIAGLPLPTQLASLQPVTFSPKLVLRLPATVLPQRSSGCLYCSAPAFVVNRIGPLVR